MTKTIPMLSLLAIVAFSSCSASSDSAWAPAGDRIMTEWGENLNPAKVWQEYPRPDMVRHGKSVILNGLWDYSLTGAEASQPQVYQGRILVPFAVESALSGVGRTVTKDDAIWYHTTFKAPRGETVLLHFEAVDWEAEVWLNGEHLGGHTGAYTRFSFDITPYLRKGRQDLVVKVKDATDNDFQPRGKQVMKPRSIWYTPVSGIWQTVWAEAAGPAYIQSYKAVPDVDGGRVLVKALAQKAQDGDRVVFKLSAGGSTVAVAQTAPGKEVAMNVPEARLWSPDDPFLYGLEVSLERDGKVIDKVDGYTAMRKVSTITDADGHKRIALNDKEIFQFGPLDQGWWPDGLHTAPCDEALKYDIVKTRDFGFNMIRKHIKVEPARWYYWCDKLGICVWQDMPSFGDNGPNHWERSEYDKGTDFPATPEAKANYYKEWSEIMDQLSNHPCINVWVPFNEAWSQFDTPEVVAFTRAKDPTRLINMASGGNWISGGVGDILDFHNYPAPAMRFVDPDMINVVGEYGGIGFPVEGHLWRADKNWGYVKYQNADEVLADYTKFAEKLREIRAEGCAAAVYTQTTDVEIEVNGLMTYDRKVIKMDEAALKQVNTSVINK